MYILLLFYAYTERENHNLLFTFFLSLIVS